MKLTTKILLSGSILGLTLLVVGSVQAQTTTTITTADLLRQISELQARIQALMIERQTVVAELSRNLSLGSSGDDVKALQEFLASQPGIYPEAQITGYFGRLTQNAVRKFQQYHGLDAVGNVGPLTREMIKALRTERVKNVVKAGVTSTTTASSTNPTFGTITICHILKGNPAAQHTLNISAAAWPAHQKHGDVMGACSGSTGETTDTTAPIISNLSETVSSTTASVSWQTNEPATGKLYYGTVNPLVLSSSTVMSFGSASVQTANLTGLATSTTYYYVIEARDAANNAATTNQRSFTTSH